MHRPAYAKQQHVSGSSSNVPSGTMRVIDIQALHTCELVYSSLVPTQAYQHTFMTGDLSASCCHKSRSTSVGRFGLLAGATSAVGMPSTTKCQVYRA